jgi:hypothetical protein
MGANVYRVDDDGFWGPFHMIPMPFALDLDDEDLMDVGAPSGRGSEPNLEPHGPASVEHGKPLEASLRKHEVRWVCSECGANVGQSGKDNAHAASCSGQHEIVKALVDAHGRVEYAATARIPERFLISE